MEDEKVHNVKESSMQVEWDSILNEVSPEDEMQTTVYDIFLLCGEDASDGELEETAKTYGVTLQEVKKYHKVLKDEGVL